MAAKGSKSVAIDNGGGFGNGNAESLNLGPSERGVAPRGVNLDLNVNDVADDDGGIYSV